MAGRSQDSPICPQRRNSSTRAWTTSPAEVAPGSSGATPQARTASLSEDDVMAAMMAVFERGGTPPHIVYTAEDWPHCHRGEQHLLSADELAEWNAAVEEYRQQRRGRRRGKG